jgi:acetate kinase
VRGAILCLNAGSSSLKFAVSGAQAEAHATLRGGIEALHASPRLIIRDGTGTPLLDRQLASGFEAALHALLDAIDAHPAGSGVVAVGHRVVHGGADHIQPERVTPALLRALEALIPLDPLHMPDTLALIRAIRAARPGLPQVACFDTAFHDTMPEVARRIALPRSITDQGVRRFGFHGLSYAFIADRLAQIAPDLARGRVIVAHLGSGASLCALKAGQSIETTTGFSALDGLVMGTRCGALDPGVILYLARRGHTFGEIEDMLYRHSGLLGVSGLSDDIRVLLASTAPQAREAIELFTYRIAAETGSLASALGGLDGLVFTAGIGEHSPEIRSAVCARLSWLGVRIGEEANRAGAPCISRTDSPIGVHIIGTDEEAIIARDTRRTLQGQTGAGMPGMPEKQP